MIICKKAYRFTRYALYKLSILLCIFMVSCEWVNDDLSGCPTGTWLHFTYTHNILDVDAAYNQVDDLSIFIFDNQGKFVGQQDVDSIQFQQNSAMVEIEQPQGDYKVLVWGGLSDLNYNHSDLIKGETLYEEVVLTLSKSSEASENSSLLNYLFHCSLDSVTVTDYYNIIEAPLVKNTNHFSILIQDETDSDFDADDFGVVIRADNGAIDYKNNLIAENYVNYTPYNQFTSVVTNTALDSTVTNSEIYVSYLNTLRLMVGDNTTFSIIQKDTDKRLLDISLVQYLLLARGYYTDTMADQEYLDRQDSYTLIFFLDKCSDGSGEYICTRLSVNGWIIRFNEAELKKI